MSEFEFPPRIGWCTKHGSTTVCKDCTIADLTAQLAAKDEEIANEKAHIKQLERGIDKAIAEKERLKEELAERTEFNRQIVVENMELCYTVQKQTEELADREKLRYDALKGEHSRSPYYYDTWNHLCDHKGIIGTSDKPPIHYAVNLLNDLQAKLARYEKSFEAYGYTDEGGELMKPPIRNVGVIQSLLAKLHRYESAVTVEAIVQRQRNIRYQNECGRVLLDYLPADLIGKRVTVMVMVMEDK